DALKGGVRCGENSSRSVAGRAFQCLEGMDWNRKLPDTKPSRKRDRTPCQVHRKAGFRNDPIPLAIDADEQMLFFAISFGPWPDIARRRRTKEFLVAFQCARVPILELMLFGCATFRGLMMERFAQNFGAENFPVIFRISQMQVPRLIHVFGRRDGMSCRD